MNPLTQQEVDKLNSMVPSMTMEQKDAVLAKMPLGPTVFDPFIRSIINQ